MRGVSKYIETSVKNIFLKILDTKLRCWHKKVVHLEFNALFHPYLSYVYALLEVFSWDSLQFRHYCFFCCAPPSFKICPFDDPQEI